MNRTTTQPETASYDQLLTEELSPESIQRNRTYAQQTPSLGDPQRALRVGALAPLFTLTDTAHKSVALADLMAAGPVVVIFYRGGWCPFCNVHLRAFQLARTQIRALGASVVLVSPELGGQTQPLAERNALLFPVLSDRGNTVARQYGLVFQMSPELQQGYLADGVDLAVMNGDPSWEVPMPATFVIDQLGSVQYAFVSADYTRRAEPADVIAVLRRLRLPR